MKSCAGVWLSRRLPLIDTPRSENLESHDSITMLRMWLQHEVCAFKRSVPKLDVTNVFDTAFTISYDTEGIAVQCGQARRKRLVEPGAKRSFNGQPTTRSGQHICDRARSVFSRQWVQGLKDESSRYQSRAD